MEKKKVQIKTWEEMEKEYTYVNKYIKDCGINVNDVYFTKNMEDRLPKDRIIEVYYNETWEEWLWVLNEDASFIADEMIKKEIKDTKEDKSLLTPSIHIGTDKVQIRLNEVIPKEEFSKELFRYSKIIEECITDTLLGRFRITSFTHLDKRFTVILLNDEVLDVKEIKD